MLQKGTFNIMGKERYLHQHFCHLWQTHEPFQVYISEEKNWTVWHKMMESQTLRVEHLPVCVTSWSVHEKSWDSLYFELILSNRKCEKKKQELKGSSSYPAVPWLSEDTHEYFLFLYTACSSSRISWSDSDERTILNGLLPWCNSPHSQVIFMRCE